MLNDQIAPDWIPVHYIFLYSFSQLLSNAAQTWSTSSWCCSSCCRQYCAWIETCSPARLFSEWSLSILYSWDKVTFHILIHWNASIFWFLWNSHAQTHYCSILLKWICRECSPRPCDCMICVFELVSRLWPRYLVLNSLVPRPVVLFPGLGSVGPWPMAQALGFTRPEVAVWCDLGSGDRCLGWNVAAVNRNGQRVLGVSEDGA